MEKKILPKSCRDLLMTDPGSSTHLNVASPRIPVLIPVPPVPGKYSNSTAHTQRQGSVAQVVAEFVRTNNDHVGRSTHTKDVISSANSVISSLNGATDPQVVNERDAISLYVQVIELYSGCEPLSSPVGSRFRDTARGSIVQLVSGCVEEFPTRLDVRGFSIWMKGFGHMCESAIPSIPVDNIPDRKVAAVCNPSIIRYSLFSKSESAAAAFILNVLRVCDDPFVSRQVSTILGDLKAMRHIKMSTDILIHDWFVNHVDIPRDILDRRTHSPLQQFINSNFDFRKIQLENEHLVHSLALLALADDKSLFDSLLPLVPVLVAIPGSFPSVIVGPHWRLALGLYCASALGDIPAILSAVDVLSSEYSASNGSAWDQDAIAVGRTFGQLGIGYATPVDALLEAKSSGVNLLVAPSRGVDKQTVLAYTILGLLWKFEKTGERVDLIISLFNTVGECDKIGLGQLILERIFSPLVAAWVSSTDSPIEVSIVDSVITLLNVMHTGSPPATRTGGLVTGTVSAPFLEEYRKLVYLVRLSVVTGSGRGSIASIFDPAVVKFSTSTAIKAADVEAVIDFIVAVCMEAEANSGPALDSAHLLGLRSNVDAEVVRKLLNAGWDSDIEIHAESVPSSEFEAIVLACVEQRLAVLVRCLTEDTSRLHGLIYTVLSPATLDELLKVKVRDEVAGGVKDWVGEDGPESVLQACNRLLLHPCLTNRPISHRITALSAAIRGLSTALLDL